MKIRSFVFMSCCIISCHELLHAAARRSVAYNDKVEIEHPFADQYSLYVPAHQLFLEQADGTVINIPKSQRPATAQASVSDSSTITTLPSISSSVTVSGPTSLFVKLPAVDSSVTMSESTILPSDRSDISSITLQESDIITAHSTTTSTGQDTDVTRSRTSKLSKKFARPATASVSSTSLYPIAPHPELWLTNNQQKVIQVTVYLKTPLKAIVYDPKMYDVTNPDIYKSSSQKIVIQPGQQIKVQVPLNSYLDSIQVAYNPIDQQISMSKDIFQARKSFKIPKIADNNLVVGAKSYAHSIVISDSLIKLDQVSKTKAQTLLNLRFE